MASFYQTFTAARTTEPNLSTLLAQLRGADPTAGLQHLPGGPYIVKKNTDWTAPQITFVQNAIDAAPASSPQLDAQAWVDRLPIEYKALVLAIIDALNQVRVQPAQAFPAITPAQAVQSIRDKAATL